jgi:predicted amidohydrolase
MASATPPAAKVATIGLLQYAPQLRDSVRDNIADIIAGLVAVRDAIIVLPEFFLGSYPDFARHASGAGASDASESPDVPDVPDATHAPEVPDALDEAELAAVLEPLRDVSMRQGLSLVGSLPIRAGRTTVNGVVVIDRGVMSFSAHTKQRLFAGESERLAPGSRADHLWIGGARCSVQVCMDIVDPLPVRQAVRAGARLVLGPATVSVDYLRTIHKARALENQVVSVFCNRPGKAADGTEYMGRSAIFLPDGSELAAPRDEEQVLLVDVDMDHVIGYEARFGPMSSPANDDGAAEGHDVEPTP